MFYCLSSIQKAVFTGVTGEKQFYKKTPENEIVIINHDFCVLCIVPQEEPRSFKSPLPVRGGETYLWNKDVSGFLSSPE